MRRMKKAHNEKEVMDFPQKNIDNDEINQREKVKITKPKKTLKEWFVVGELVSEKLLIEKVAGCKC